MLIVFGWRFDNRPFIRAVSLVMLMKFFIFTAFLSSFFLFSGDSNAFSGITFSAKFRGDYELPQPECQGLECRRDVRDVKVIYRENGDIYHISEEEYEDLRILCDDNPEFETDGQ